MPQYSQSNNGQDILRSNSTFIRLITAKYMLPTVVSILGTTIVSFANSLLAGQFLGNDALAGFNIAGPITFLFAMIGCIVNIGGSISASAELGKENTEGFYSYISLSLILTVALSLVMTVIGIIFLKPFVIYSGAEGAVYDTAVEYGYFLLVSGILTALMYYYFNYLRADGRGNSSMGIFILMAALDIVLAYILLKAGLGVKGLGLAVVFSSLVADVLGLFILFKGKDSAIRLGKIGKYSDKVRNIWKMGAASGVNNLSNLLRTIFLNILILSYFGPAGLSIFAVVCAIINFTQATVAGAGQTTSSIVSVFYAGRDYLSVKTVLKISVKNAVIIQGITLVIAAVFSKQIVGLFGIHDAEIVGPAVIAVIWVTLSLIPAAINNILIFYLSAIQKTFYSSLFTFLRSFGFVYALMLVLGKTDLGVHSYAAFFIGELITLVGLYFITVPDLKSKKDVFDLEFSVDLDNESVDNAGQRIAEFLEDKEKLPPKVTMAIPLALEEILALIKDHANTKDNTESDVRIAIGGEDIMLRIRCGGEIFDPIKYYNNRKETLSAEELLEDDSLGIMILTNLCKEIKFERTFGVNNLTIVVPV